jgi:hypothetical protein
MFVSSHGPSVQDYEIFYHLNPSSDTLADDATKTPAELQEEISAFKPL